MVKISVAEFFSLQDFSVIAVLVSEKFCMNYSSSWFYEAVFPLDILEFLWSLTKYCGCLQCSSTQVMRK